MENEYIYSLIIVASTMCVKHANQWLAHPLHCSKGISCGGPGQPPSEKGVCSSNMVYSPSDQKCDISVDKCTMMTVVPDSCNSNPCQNGGVCSTPFEGDHAFLCKCSTNYVGTCCERGILFILFIKKIDNPLHEYLRFVFGMYSILATNVYIHLS